MMQFLLFVSKVHVVSPSEHLDDLFLFELVWEKITIRGSTIPVLVFSCAYEKHL